MNFIARHVYRALIFAVGCGTTAVGALCAIGNKLGWTMSNVKSEANAGELAEDSIIELGRSINVIRELTTACGISHEIALPTIAVVGSQSVGKSSVLENIAGREFFPRGKDVVTRLPLVLQIVRIPAEREGWVEFAHRKGIKFHDDECVRAEIIAETTNRAGDNDGIVDDPIHLTMFSPCVAELTLVDLPGLVCNVLPGQPANLPETVREMVLKYIQEENTIILAVSDAGMDLQISESLKFAKEVDPDGSRTFGVITKLDLRTEPASVKVWTEVLGNRRIPLKWGYVGVVNAEVDAAKDGHSANFAAIRANEKKFFKKFYPSMASKQGTPFLRRKLATGLAMHVMKTAPMVKTQLEKKKRELTETLKVLGMEVDGTTLRDTTHMNLRKSMWETIGKFATKLSAIEGFVSEVSTDSLSHGPALQKFLNAIMEQIEDVEAPTIDEVRIIMRNVLGIQSPVTTPQQSFHVIIRNMLDVKFRPPVMYGLESMTDEMEKSITECLEVLDAFPKLRTTVQDLMIAELRKNQGDCQAYLTTFMKLEAIYPNFNHPEFVRKKFNQQLIELRKQAEKIKNEDDQQVPNLARKIDDEIKALTETLEKGDLHVNWEERFNEDAEKGLQEVTMYLDVLEMTLVDQIPKALVSFLVHKTIDYAKNDLRQEDDLCVDPTKLMEVSVEKKLAKETTIEQFTSVRKALEELQKFRI